MNNQIYQQIGLLGVGFIAPKVQLNEVEESKIEVQVKTVNLGSVVYNYGRVIDKAPPAGI